MASPQAPTARWLRRYATGAAARARSAAAALAVAVGTGLLFDVAFSIVRGTALNLGYVVLCGLLMLAGGAACVAVAALLPGTGMRVALALYVALHGCIDPAATSDQTTNGFVIGALTWILLSPRGLARIRMSPADAGAITSAALCATLVLWPYAAGVIRIPEVIRFQWFLENAFVFALVMLAAGFWEAMRARLRFSAALALWVGLALAIDATALAFRLLRPQSVAVLDAPGSTSHPALPDIFVIVLDTVRADHLASYGYVRDTTPNLTHFLAAHPDAVQYDLAFSPASWTVPAHASLLTGLMPSAHRARSAAGRNLLGSATETLSIVADETLAEALSGAGYCTAAVVANAFLLRVDGLQRGFEAFFEPDPTRPLQLLGHALRRRFVPGPFAGEIKPYPSARAINDHVVRLREKCAPRAAFVLANYMEAHSPFLAPYPYAGRFAGDHPPTVALDDAFVTDSDATIALKRDRYDESISYLDANLGRLFARLEASGVLSRAWLFITADHGESFREHETTSHGSSIYNEQVRVPLIVKPPLGVRLPTTREPVSLLDVSTTIAAIAGSPRFGVGHDLRQPLQPGRAIGMEFRGKFRTDVRRYGATADEPARAVVVGNMKLLERDGRYELYDLVADPGELADRSDDPTRVAHLAPALPRERARNGDAGDGEGDRALSPDEIENLRALGYLR